METLQIADDEQIAWTVNEFKYQKRSDFIANFCKEVYTSLNAFYAIVQGKESGRDLQTQIQRFRDSYFHLIHFYEKCYHLYLKDHQLHDIFHKIISSVKNVNDLADKVVLHDEIAPAKKEFSQIFHDTLEQFEQMTHRLTHYGILMWI